MRATSASCCASMRRRSITMERIWSSFPRIKRSESRGIWPARSYPSRVRMAMKQSGEYAATTEEVTIRVGPVYIHGQSDPMGHKFVFAYFSRVENHGSENVQLLRRHWFINHAGGRVEEVEG